MYKKFFIVTALVLALAAGLAAAGTQGSGGPQGGHHGWMLKRMTRELNLTDAQQSQIKSILQAQRAKTQPMREQLRQNRQSWNGANNGSFDEAQTKAFASKQAQLMSSLMVERERTKAQIFAVLTPEQRQKAQQLMQEHQQRRFHHQQKPQAQSQQSPG